MVANRRPSPPKRVITSGEVAKNIVIDPNEPRPSGPLRPRSPRKIEQQLRFDPHGTERCELRRSLVIERFGHAIDEVSLVAELGRDASGIEGVGLHLFELEPWKTNAFGYLDSQFRDERGPQRRAHFADALDELNDNGGDVDTIRQLVLIGEELYLGWCDGSLLAGRDAKRLTNSRAAVTRRQDRIEKTPGNERTEAQHRQRQEDSDRYSELMDASPWGAFRDHARWIAAGQWGVDLVESGGELKPKAPYYSRNLIEQCPAFCLSIAKCYDLIHDALRDERGEDRVRRAYQLVGWFLEGYLPPKLLKGSLSSEHGRMLQRKMNDFLGRQPTSRASWMLRRQVDHLVS